MRQAQIPTGQAASRTVRERSQSLTNVRFAISAGDTTTQLAHEVHASKRENRQELLDEIRKVDGNFLVRVPVQASLAMKADFNIPWNRLRDMRR